MKQRSGTLLIVIFFLAVHPGWAQNRTSSISGTVTDGSGAVVAGARIVARSLTRGTSRSANTDGDGLFRVPRLEVGEYELTVEMDGFKTGRYPGLVLEIDREVVVNPVLEVGERSESVVVNGQARTIEAAPSALTSLVDGAAIERLPLNGRDYIQLAALQTGVPVARNVARNVNAGYGIQISISGSRPYQNGFQLDGVSLVTYNGSTPGSVNGVNLGVDAIQEFSVLSSTYSAEYGRAAGGIINAVTKSGGNDFHGSLFYFHRNDNLDARNFFDPGEPPEFRRHQFGGSLGGPIVRNRSFFFASYEGLREGRGITTINTTLSEQARKGNLVRGTVAVDPVMAKVAALYPLPNGQVLGDAGLFVFSNDVVSDEDFVTTRFDQNLGDADKLFFRYSFDDGSRADQSAFALGDRSNITRNQSAVLEHTHIFSPNMIGSARFGFLRTHTAAGRTVTRVPATDDPELAFLPVSEVLGITIVSGLTDHPGGTGALDSDRHIFNSFQPSADITWLTGPHSLKLGGRFERTQFNTDSQNLVSGDFRFGSIADFLTNRPNRFRAQMPESDTVRGHRQWTGALYMHDTWRVSSRFTLDLGVRWEWTTVPTEVNGKVANLDELRDPEMRVGDPLYDNPSLANVAPRLGIAWDVFGNQKTMVRTGYGIFPDLLLSQYILTPGVRNPPFFLRGIASRLSPGDYPKGGFATLLENPSPEYRVERIPRDISQPYVQQWNFNIEQMFDANHSLRVGYVGSHGVNLASMVEDADLVEPIQLADGRLFFPADGARINPAFGRIRDRNFNAHSFYHALQTQFRKRMSQGLQTQVAYTFSKSIDDSSNFFAVTEASNSISLPLSGNPRFNRGLSGHDVRHYLVVSGSWQLPLAEGPGWRRVLGGWDTAAIVTYASGLPMSARLGYDAARTKTSQPAFDSGQRPDMAPGAGNPVTGNPEHWVDVSAFRRPEPGFLGNAGRNNIIGPDLATVDLSVGKQIRIPALGEGGVLDFRVEAFNLLNRTNFDLPEPQRMEMFNATSTREDVARITSAGKSREIQFGLKLRF